LLKSYGESMDLKKLRNRPGWTYRELLNPKTGERKNRYFYKRRVAKRVELTSRLTQQLAGYVLIEKDLRNVLLWLSKIDELVPEDHAPAKGDTYTKSTDRELYSIVKGLFVAVVTFYGKCFTTCEGRRVKLDRSWIDNKYKEEHDTMMKFRHNFAAHSGADKFEEVKIVAVLDPKKHRGTIPVLVKELKQPDVLMSKSDEKGSEELVQYLQSKVLTKIHALEEKVLNEDVIAKGKDYWY